MRAVVLLLSFLLPLGGCAGGRNGEAKTESPREEMVREQLAGRDIRDERVLAAMRRVPREEFVPARWQRWAYDDRALPIEEDQTISQPYIVALMSQLADVQPNEKVLEIGTGSGYQAAVLGELANEVYSIEIVPSLATTARERLGRLGYGNVHVRQGDGFRGWPEQAPFDAIIVTAAPDEVPPPLIEQLAIGGHLVIPVGEGMDQKLVRLTRTELGLERKTIAPVFFVPMTGEAER